MTLTEFLLARITEDEARFQYGCPGSGEYTGCDEQSDRLEAYLRGARAIVQEHTPVDEEPGNWCNDCSSDVWPCPTMAALSGIYADHPDYREEWRP